MNHSPLPWILNPSKRALTTKDGQTGICRGYWWRAPAYQERANMRFIATACNSYYELLEELKRQVKVLRDTADLLSSFPMDDDYVSGYLGEADKLEAFIKEHEK